MKLALIVFIDIFLFLPSFYHYYCSYLVKDSAGANEFYQSVFNHLNAYLASLFSIILCISFGYFVKLPNLLEDSLDSL
jgi:hypothetical protein